MKTIHGATRSFCRAFARADLIILATIALGVLWYIHVYSQPVRRRGHPVRCVSNQKQIGLAFRIWANEHDDKYPFTFDKSREPITGTSLYQNTTNAEPWMHFQLLSNEIQNARIVLCPEDRDRIANGAEDFLNSPTSLSGTNKRDAAVSYFVGLGAGDLMPQSIMSGDRNLSFAPGRPLYSSKGGARRINQRSSWSGAGSNLFHTNMGNITMADGSVLQVSIEKLQEALKKAERDYGTNANTFLFPQ